METIFKEKLEEEIDLFQKKLTKKKQINNSNFIRNLINNIKTFIIKLMHRIFGCPEKYLTESYKIRICHKCGEIHYEDKRIEQILKQRIN